MAPRAISMRSADALSIYVERRDSWARRDGGSGSQCAGFGAGMDVAPGEIIHMDENGAVKFPADKLEAVLQ